MSISPFSRRQNEEIQQKATLEPNKPVEEKVIPMEQESESKSELQSSEIKELVSYRRSYGS